MFAHSAKNDPPKNHAIFGTVFILGVPYGNVGRIRVFSSQIPHVANVRFGTFKNLLDLVNLVNRLYTRDRGNLF